MRTLLIFSLIYSFYLFLNICTLLDQWESTIKSVLCWTNESPLLYLYFVGPMRVHLLNFKFMIGCYGFYKRHSIGRVMYPFVGTNLILLKGFNLKFFSSVLYCTVISTQYSALFKKVYSFVGHLTLYNKFITDSSLVWHIFFFSA